MLRTWAPKGETPVLRYRFNWQRLSAISGVTPTGYLYFRLHVGTIRSEQVIGFLRQLLRLRRDRLLILWDRSPTHRSRKVQAFVRRWRRRITVEWLPAYAPELNPDEYVWAYLKRVCLANFCPRHLGELRQEIHRGARRLKQRPHIVRDFYPAAGLHFVSRRSS